jgi:hypothetical protein
MREEEQKIPGYDLDAALEDRDFLFRTHCTTSEGEITPPAAMTPATENFLLAVVSPLEKNPRQAQRLGVPGVVVST